LLEAVRGVVEGVIGKVKEVIGALTGRNDLFNEGQAQREQGGSAAQRRQEGSAGRKGAR